MARLLDDGTISLVEGSAFLSLRDYSVDKKPLAVGSAATVYAGHRSQGDSGDDQPDEIALKVITPPASAVDHLALLNKEVDVFAAVQGHPNILGFYGVCLMEQAFNGKASWAIQMEACAEDLHDAVLRKRFPEVEACSVTAGILQGLAHMNELGFVHRDVKLENVLLTKDGIVKVADFGISCRLSDKAAMGKRCGTPGFAAPELLRGQEYGIKIDTFSCGAVVYGLISGKRPFSGDTIQAVMKKTLEAPVNFRKSMLLERLSDDSKEFIMALLEKDPTDRPTASQGLGMLAWLKESDPEVVQDDAHLSRKYFSECSLDRENSASTMYRDSTKRTAYSESAQTTSDATSCDRNTSGWTTPRVSGHSNTSGFAPNPMIEEHMDQIAEQEMAVMYASSSPLSRRRRRPCEGNVRENQPMPPTNRRPSHRNSFLSRLLPGRGTRTPDFSDCAPTQL